MHRSEAHHTNDRGIKDRFHKHFGAKDEPQPTYQPMQAGGPSPYQQAGGPGPYQQAGGPPYQQPTQMQAGGPPQYQQAGGPPPYQQAPAQPYQPGPPNASAPPYQQPGCYPNQAGGQYGEGVKVEEHDKAHWKEENDLAMLLKSLETCIHTGGGDPNRLVEMWISEKEVKLNKWRKGMKTGAGVQTFGIGLVTFGLGPIPINMSILSGLNKHIVHTFTLDDDRVEGFMKNTWAYGGKELGKKLATLLAKTALQVGTSSAVGIVPLIGPAISATMTTHKINKISKETMQNCADLVREICQEALRTNYFNL